MSGAKLCAMCGSRKNGASDILLSDCEALLRELTTYVFGKVSTRWASIRRRCLIFFAALMDAKSLNKITPVPLARAVGRPPPSPPHATASAPTMSGGEIEEALDLKSLCGLRSSAAGQQELRHLGLTLLNDAVTASGRENLEEWLAPLCSHVFPSLWKARESENVVISSALIRCLANIFENVNVRLVKEQLEIFLGTYIIRETIATSGPPDSAVRHRRTSGSRLADTEQGQERCLPFSLGAAGVVSVEAG